MNYKTTFAFALLAGTFLSTNVNATLNINDSVLVNGKYEITGNVGTGGITEDITLHKTDTNPFPELTISERLKDIPELLLQTGNLTIKNIAQ